MKLKILLLLLWLSNTCFSQKTEPIQADRPDQTETPAIVPKGMFQVETGFTFQKNENHNETWSLPSTLWKYGVNGNFEVRLITEFVSEKIDDEKLSGFSPVLIGFKVSLCQEKGIVPKTSFIGHVSLPNAASSKYKTDYSAPEFRFTMQHTLSEKLSLGYNLGCEWDGVTPATTYIYTLTTGYAVTNKLGSYIELFGFAPQDDSANHNLDGGVTYLITDNFMVDLSSGVGLTDNAPEHYIAFGFSFRQ
ncbi:transporter [Flavobacterium phycosphaerae]|uniref:transporter n=1 Tax=Flavobacterium phycosphaerae TaxID=2697515 RepID=UPI001389E44B|nr:transporter [Flavobacterium phycosphaerae]